MLRPGHIVSSERKRAWGLPWQSSVYCSKLLKQRAQVPSLVRELRSHRPQGRQTIPAAVARDHAQPNRHTNTLEREEELSL